MGLHKGKVQNVFTGSYMLPSADDKRKINREGTRKAKEKKKVIYNEAHLTLFLTQGLKS
jgi:hypothetical protein